MFLFSKTIEEITFDDVVAFCNQQIEEGIRIEYKDNFSSKNPSRQIAKEIASFANTHGGLLLIGVKENNRKPILPIEGIPKEGDLKSRVETIAFQAINPPIFPEVQVCDVDENKSVILVRVHESAETPHRVEQDTKIYIRVASQNEPVEAPFEEIEWLLSKRKKSLDHKNYILERAEQRFNTLISGRVLNSLRKFYAVPVFPKAGFCRYSDLPDIAKGIHIIAEFPTYSPNGEPIQDSLVFMYSPDDNKYSEINTSGLFFSKEDISEKDFSCTVKDEISFDDSLKKLVLAVMYAKKFYEALSFKGLVEIGYLFENVSFIKLAECKERREFRRCPQLDNAIFITRTIPIHKLESDFENLINEMMQEVLWSFGHNENIYLLGRIKEVLRSYRLT